jgi:hypothetical protein
MQKIITSLVLAAAVLATPAIARERDNPDVKLAKLLDGRVAGPPSHCISLPWTSGSQIIAGRAIAYRQGGTLWVNQPRSGAESLRGDDILLTRTSTTQLCSIDTVNLIDRASHIQRGFVVLGDFVPYRLPAKH